MLERGVVTLMVTDFDRSIRFYVETLGLKLRARAGNDWAEVDGTGVTIGLHVKRREIAESGSGTAAIGFEVADLDAAIQSLKAKGVAVGRVLGSPERRMAMFDDPDGNHLYVIRNTG